MEEFTYKRIPFNHPKNEQKVFEDLIEKYEKFESLYIGVDFDNTILPYGEDDICDEMEDTESEYYEGLMSLIELLRWAKTLNMKLCLWTLPTSQENLDWKIKWCSSHGIEMDYINESPLLDNFSKKFGKPHFNLLLDDTAGLESSFNILYNLCEYIQQKQEKNHE